MAERKDQQCKAPAQEGARPTIIAGTMDGYIYVDPPALDDKAVQKWIRLAIIYVQTLSPKTGAKLKKEKRSR